MGQKAGGLCGRNQIQTMPVLTGRLHRPGYWGFPTVRGLRSSLLSDLVHAKAANARSSSDFSLCELSCDLWCEKKQLATSFSENCGSLQPKLAVGFTQEYVWGCRPLAKLWRELDMLSPTLATKFILKKTKKQSRTLNTRHSSSSSLTHPFIFAVLDTGEP